MTPSTPPRPDPRRPVVVTGAGSGIGAATARLFGSLGHPVAALDIKTTAADATRAAIESAGGRAISLDCDVTSTESTERAHRAALECFGDLGIVAACAGIATTGTASELTIDEWDAVLAVNLTGVLHTVRAALPALLARGEGAIVIVASDAAVRGSSNFTAYCASKHGVLGLMRCLALDYGPRGVRTNAVCPSFTATPMADEIVDRLSLNRATLEQARPLRRLASPSEVARVIVHLASSDATYTNGLAYAVDGGLTAG